MPKKVLIISGSPKKNGNTAQLIEWFAQGARSKGADVNIVHAAFLKFRVNGCTACRKCQKIKEYKCAIADGAANVLADMIKADVIVMATPLYFFDASAQIKQIIDRMFCLYKWDNNTDTFESPLIGKTFVLLASAYEDTGLDALEKPFKLIANYTKMKFFSLLVPNAGESGEISNVRGIKGKAVKLGKAVSS
ncbi:MAG: flavodoxin family protein [Candidatus Margulisiibacteriota bacterium]